MAEEEVKKEEVTKDDVERVVTALKKENAEVRELLERRERLLSAEQNAGLARAGEQPPVKKEETPQEYAKRIMEGRL